MSEKTVYIYNCKACAYKHCAERDERRTDLPEKCPLRIHERIELGDKIG